MISRRLSHFCVAQQPPPANRHVAKIAWVQAASDGKILGMMENPKSFPRAETSSTLVLVLNHREGRKTTNSGLLAARCVARHEIHVSGLPGAPLNFAAILPEKAANLCLFPAPDAKILAASWLENLAGPVRLIVPDGNWSQAGKLRRKLAAHGRVQFVTLPLDGVGRPHPLRRPVRGVPFALSTFEAIARAMTILEGRDVAAEIMPFFEAEIERELMRRGRPKASHGDKY